MWQRGGYPISREGYPSDQLNDGDSRYCTVQHEDKRLFPALSKEYKMAKGGYPISRGSTPPDQLNDGDCRYYCTV